MANKKVSLLGLSSSEEIHGNLSSNAQLKADIVQDIGAGGPPVFAADVLFDAEYNTPSVNATYVKTGTIIGVPFNGAVVTAGMLDELDIVDGGVNINSAYVQYDVGCLSTMTQKGTVRFSATQGPNDDIPNPQQLYLVVGDYPSGIANNILIGAFFGALQALVVDSTGSVIVSLSAPYAPSPGQTDEIEVCFDFDAGLHNLFLNGVSIATSSETATRGSAPGAISVGSTALLGTFANNNAIDNLVMYDTVQHTAGFASPIAPLTSNAGPVTTRADIVLSMSATNTPNGRCLVSLYDKNNHLAASVMTKLKNGGGELLRLIADSTVDVSANASTASEVIWKVAPDLFSTGRIELEATGKLSNISLVASNSTTLLQVAEANAIVGSGQYVLSIPLKVELL